MKRRIPGTLAMATALLLTACSGDLVVAQGNTLPPPPIAATVTATRTPPVQPQVDMPYDPVWRCGTPTPVVTSCPNNDKGTPTCTTPVPTATPFNVVEDFPLGKHIQVGPIGKERLGLWVWADLIEVRFLPDRKGPYGEKQWVAIWSVTVQNASLSENFSFNPGLQSFVNEVEQEDGTRLKGQWFPSEQSALDAGLTILDYDPASIDFAVVVPGEISTAKLAVQIPGPKVIRLGYTLVPTSAAFDNDLPGGNELIWSTEQDQKALDACTSEVTPGPDGIDANPVPNGQIQLARWPISNTNNIKIVRGYGCSDVFTGEIGTQCPASQPFFHNGIDIELPAGTEYIDVLPNDGSISFAGADSGGADCSSLAGALDPKTGLGNYVMHSGVVNEFVVTIYGAHLSSISVASGNKTSAGQVLGRTGSTGCSSAAHLHFAVTINGYFVDPITVLPYLGAGG